MTLEWSLGISQQQSLVTATQHCTSQICHSIVHSGATQDSTFPLTSLFPTVKSTVNGMLSPILGQPLTCLCLSLDTLHRILGGFICSTLHMQLCLAADIFLGPARQHGLRIHGLLGIQKHPRLQSWLWAQSCQLLCWDSDVESLTVQWTSPDFELPAFASQPVPPPNGGFIAHISALILNIYGADWMSVTENLRSTSQ